MIALLLAGATAALADERVDLVYAGDPATHTDIVFLAEGFTAADMPTFRTWVDTIVRDAFGSGPLGATVSAFNIARVELVSNDSGVGSVLYTPATVGGDACNGALAVDGAGAAIVDTQTTKDTVFGTQTNCRNTSCWFTNPTDIMTRVDDKVATWAPGADLVILVMNTMEFGACSGSIIQTTLASNATTIVHELGHRLGGLGDEYLSKPSGGVVTYTGPEPGWPNLTIDKTGKKWKRFLDPLTPVPTDPATIAKAMYPRTVGAFEGGTPGYAGSGAEKGVWRATADSIMAYGTTFSPLGYEAMVNASYANAAPINEVLVGDFDGDGRSDLFQHRGSQVDLYLSVKGELVPTWFEGLSFPGWDAFLPGDRFFVADFDGDGKDDLFVVNTADFHDGDGYIFGYLGLLRSNGAGFDLVARYDGVLPAWDRMAPSDQFFVGDFDGDGLEDLAAYNGDDYDIGYLGLMRSTGASLEGMVRYDERLPGWTMRTGDQVLVGDFDGDGSDDVALSNTRSWSMGYLGLFRSNGQSLDLVVRYDGDLPGWDDMLSGDVLYVGDFDGDGSDDLALYNSTQWNQPYLGLAVSQANGFAPTVLYGTKVPGWRFHVHDHHAVARVDGKHGDDLFVWNVDDWGYPYLGALLFTPDGVTGGHVDTSVGLGTPKGPAYELAGPIVWIPADLAGNQGPFGFADLLSVRTDITTVSIFGWQVPKFEIQYASVAGHGGGTFDPLGVYPRYIANFDYEAAGYY